MNIKELYEEACKRNNYKELMEDWVCIFGDLLMEIEENAVFDTIEKIKEKVEELFYKTEFQSNKYKMYKRLLQEIENCHEYQ